MAKEPKTDTKTLSLPEDLLRWVVGLEGRDVIVQRGVFAIRRSDWPFVVRIAYEPKREEWVLLAGYRTETGAIFQPNPVARGVEGIKSAVEQLLELDEAKVANFGEAMLCQVFCDLLI